MPRNCVALSVHDEPPGCASFRAGASCAVASRATADTTTTSALFTPLVPPGRPPDGTPPGASGEARGHFAPRQPRDGAAARDREAVAAEPREEGLARGADDDVLPVRDADRVHVAGAPVRDHAGRV